MANVNDLHLTSEIIPLFDHTSNDQASECLCQLICELPATLEIVLERQALLKAILEDDRLFKPCPYAKSEFKEVYSYSRELEERSPITNGAGQWLYLLWNKSDRHHERGRLQLLLDFLNRIRDAYLPENGDLPAWFRPRLNEMLSLITELDAEKYSAGGRHKGLNSREIIRLQQTLHEFARSGRMKAFWQSLHLFEAYLSIARTIRQKGFVLPKFDDQTFVLEGFFHPQLKHPVRNNLKVDKPVQLISGPNMSGKSTLLRSVGLCVYLARLGLAVPASKFQIPFYDDIFIFINPKDDLKKGLSHFMTEVTHLKEVVTRARNGSSCFVIFDELFRGTNTADALAISRTTIDGLTQYGNSAFFISTHHYALKDLLTQHGGIAVHCMPCEVVDGTLRFSYHLREGWSQMEIGQLIFRQVGLDEGLQRAD